MPSALEYYLSEFDTTIAINLDTLQNAEGVPTEWCQHKHHH